MKFSEPEINALISKWGIGKGLINYSGFCENIDSVFLDTVDDRAVIENSKSTANFTEDEKTMLCNLLMAIRTEIKNKRILIKPQFQDYDTSKCCHITTEQFRRVMKDIGLLPPTEEMFQVLVRKYFDKGNVREMNYFEFCKDIDRPEDLFNLYQAKHPNNEPPLMLGQLRDAGSTFFKQPTQGLDAINNRFQQQRIDISADPSDIENRIQALVVMKRVRIEEFFLDFDKLRKGHVHTSQVASILSMLNFTISKEEFQSLADKYATGVPDQFNYKAFCANINSAFTTYGI